MRRLLTTRLEHVMRRLQRRSPRARHFAFAYEHVLGTSFELQVVAPRESVARRAEAMALAEIDRLSPVLSGWSSTSELALWLATHDADVPISAELAAVLELSTMWRERTGGAFDPAVQSIVERLCDGRGDGVALRPAHEPLWLVERDGATARRLTRDAISLDAIAKGYIVARAAERARAVEGVADLLLNVGGDVQHFGERAALVGVADPFAPAENAPPISVVRLRNAALATSGGYRRGFLVNGRRVSHIVDPRTGQPAERIASASVLAPDCATADALSTAFSVMPPLACVALADSLGDVGCLLVEHDGTVTTNALWNDGAAAAHHETTS
jgi:thiamine biosynthesis lipoprotein